MAKVTTLEKNGYKKESEIVVEWGPQLVSNNIIDVHAFTCVAE
jgi:hypothetical protein